MFHILGHKAFIAFGVWITILAIAALSALGLDYTALRLGSSLALIISLVLGGLLFVAPKVQFVHKIFARFVMPVIAGEYEVTLESNWPVIEQMHKAATGRAEVIRDPLSPLPDLLTCQFDATIEQTWTTISMVMTPKEKAATPLRRSVADFIYPRRLDGGRIELAYVYRQVSDSKSIIDPTEHIGAARIELSRDVAKPLVLSGDYWTSRSWRSGLNTAGRITFTKVATARKRRRLS